MRRTAFRAVVLLCVLAVGFSCGTQEKNAQQAPEMWTTAAPSANVNPTAAQKSMVQSRPRPLEATSPQSADAGLNVKLTNQAWEAFNKGDFDASISAADRCINEFLGSAMREQEDLVTKRVPQFPTGAVTNQERQMINSHGLLNDTATCLYIKGRSLEAKKQREEAVKVYETTAKFTYARCWDPQGWFWSLSEGAQDRLRVLK